LSFPKGRGPESGRAASPHAFLSRPGAPLSSTSGGDLYWRSSFWPRSNATPTLPAHLVSVLCLLAALLSGPGCSTRFIRHRAERRIEQRLVSLIGPAERYRVRLRHTKDAAIVGGRFRRIEVDGWNVRVGDQLTLETLHLVLLNLRYHAPPGERLSVGDSELVISVSQEALNDYLRRQHPSLQPAVSLENGRVTLKGNLRLLGVPTPIVTVGRLEIQERTRVEFRADSVQFSTDPAPDLGPEYVEKQLNPVLNVARLELPLRLDQITMQPGHLIVRGTAYLPQPAKAR
jgi:hypothetical protein